MALPVTLTNHASFSSTFSPSPKSDCSTLENLSKNTGYSFRDIELIKTSLIHRSMLVGSADKCASNERLEFLGDSVLETIVRKFLFSRFPNDCEGRLSQLKDCLVSKNACFQYASTIDLEQFVLVDDSVPMDNEKTRRTILANTFEALLGAIFLDGGYLEAEKFFLDKALFTVEKIITHPPKNWKQSLQHYLQRECQSVPNYQVVREQDLRYLKSFDVIVLLGEAMLGQGNGFSKKEAEQEAAKNALENLERGLNLPKVDLTILNPRQTPHLRKEDFSSTFPRVDSINLEKQQSLSALSMLRQLMTVHQRIAHFLMEVDLESSGLTPEEQSFLKAQQQITPPRKKVAPIMLMEGRKKLVSPVIREMVDLSPLSMRTREIFARIQANDPYLSVHFLNDTLKDKDLVVLARLLESNTVLHQLYLRSLSIEDLGIKALKRVLLFNKTLTRLEINYSSDFKKSLFQIVYNALELNNNKTLLDITLYESWYSRKTPPIYLTRYSGFTRFDLKPLEVHLKNLL